jgi:hypothetical protein
MAQTFVVPSGPGRRTTGSILGWMRRAIFFGGEFGEVAVLGEVEGMEEALGDVGVGLAEVDVEDVGGDVAGDGEEGAFDAFDLDAGEAVEAEGEGGEVERAVAGGVGGLAGAEEVGGDGAGIRAGRRVRRGWRGRCGRGRGD